MDLTQRIVQALRAAQHPEAQRQPDELQADGFVVDSNPDGSADVRWDGGDAADPMLDARRRFFLARYADTLTHAGVRAVLVDGPGEPSLHCPRQ